MKVFLDQLLKYRLKSPSNSGFTILELLVVVVIIGILAAIAAPSWISFTNQRRVNAASNKILQALQEAKSKAKQTKLSYSVSFRTVDEVPQIAIYPTSAADDGLDDIVQAYWQVGDLGNELGIQSGQVTIGTNLGTNTDNNANQATNTFSYDLDNDNVNNIRTITFDYLGGLPDEPEPTLNTDNNEDTVEGLIITVARATQNYTEPVDSSRKCVKVVTLLGSIQVGEDEECE